MNRIAMLVLALMCAAAVAAERQVVVNGVLLDPAQLARLDALAGLPVEDGAYWLDPDTGIWGYADDPTPRGRIGTGGGYGYGTPGGSYSERGAVDDGETDWSGFRMPQ